MVAESNATACGSWVGNHVSGDGYGPVIATTAFYIQPTTSQLPYYTSNDPLLLNVTLQVCCDASGVSRVCVLEFALSTRRHPCAMLLLWI